MGVGTFLKHHFGTDMLLSSWFFLVSSVIYVIVGAIQLQESLDDELYLVMYAITFVVCVIFAAGSYVFLLLSYPAALDEMMERLILVDIDKMTFTEKYFTGNEFLVMAWIFMGAFLLIYIFPIWAMAVGEYSLATGFEIIAVLTVCLFPFFALFLVAAMPHNLITNNGAGSSHVFDFFSCCCCGFECSCLREYAGTDMLLAVWGFFVVAVVATGASAYYVAIDPSQLNIWQLIPSVMFLIGVIFMLVSMRPGQMKSDFGWKMLTCQCCCCNNNEAKLRRSGDEYDDTLRDENRRSFEEDKEYFYGTETHSYRTEKEKELTEYSSLLGNGSKRNRN